MSSTPPPTTLLPPAPGPGPFRTADRLWLAVRLMAGALVPLWALTFLVTEGSEHVEQCAHGMIGPGGHHRVERTSVPYNATCVYPDGTELPALGALEWLWWAFLVALAVLVLVAYTLEFALTGRPESRRRFLVLTVVTGTLFLGLWLLATQGPASCPPGLEGPVVAREESLFPPQRACVHASGTVRELVPDWLSRLTVILLVATALSAAGAVRAHLATPRK
ncbi:hypothetical protein [Streptomyces sp. NPDC051567]|uniref:hypothetical protein n=1 Tax=Streptomyces sp. NPDC051567 TaxID=3365660 RepID=UPI00379B2702